MTYLKHCISVLLLTAALALPASPPSVNAAKAGMDPELLARIPARMKAYVEKGARSWRGVRLNQ